MDSITDANFQRSTLFISHSPNTFDLHLIHVIVFLLQPVESHKTSRQQEDSLRSHQHTADVKLRECREEDEVLADDELDFASKSNESEHTIYDGSYDGLSKADFSVVESVVTRMGQSKSIATEDALYDDTSSESEINAAIDDSQLERYLNSTPIDIDDDDDLTRVDSMIAASEAPGLVDCDESDDGTIFDHFSRGDTLMASSVAPNPLQPDDTDGENIGNSIRDEDRTLENSISQSLRTTSKKVSARKLEASKWPAEANEATSLATSRIKSPQRLDLSKWEKQVVSATIRSTVIQQPSQQKHPSKSPSSSERAKLKSDIDRLREQIRELEQQKNVSGTKGRGYMKPHELVVSNNSDNVEEPIAAETQIHSDASEAKAMCNETNELADANYGRSAAGLENIVDVRISMEDSEDNSTRWPPTSNHSHHESFVVDKESHSANTSSSDHATCCITLAEGQLGNESQENDAGFEDPVNIVAINDVDSVIGDEKRGDRAEEKDSDINAPIELSYFNGHSDHGCNRSNGRVPIEPNEIVPSCDRRESLDSAFMQYSVSTNGRDSNFDQSCDDASTQLCGTSDDNSKINVPLDDEIQLDMTKASSTSEDHTERKMSDSTKGTIPSKAHEKSNIENESELLQPFSNRELHSDLQSLHYNDKTVKIVNKEVNNSIAPGLDTIANSGDELLSHKSDQIVATKPSMNKQPNHETPAQDSRFEKERFEASKKSIDVTDFVNLLNLDPWNRESKLDEQQIFDMLEQQPSLCCQKYNFEGFHGYIYPLSALCALRASIAMIKRCYLAFPQAITKADACVGTSLHYACSYHASLSIVEFLSKKHPLALKAVNQFNRLPLHM